MFLQEGGMISFTILWDVCWDAQVLTGDLSFFKREGVFLYIKICGIPILRSMYFCILICYNVRRERTLDQSGFWRKVNAA